MAYQALYRKWRPATFDDVVGQGHVVATLKNEIMSGKTAHAYLFCGTRGTGKTSCAKIFARAINCLNPKNGNPCNECEICRGVANGSILDITEIDAASNNGVDNIREIREEVVYSAAQAKYKIYIIDEVHMLSAGAFNALLKTLEEPPAHVVFILATTEAHKLPATITSRCQRFDFKRIGVKDIVVRLKEIVAAEAITANEEALCQIARMADGAMRDALSILDQCMSACPDGITLDNIGRVLGIAPDDTLNAVVDAVAGRDAAAVVRCLDSLIASGRDLGNFIDTLLRRFRDIMVCGITGGKADLFEYSAENTQSIEAQSKRFIPEQLSYIIQVLCGAQADAKWSANARIIYELAFMKLCDSRLDDSVAALARRIANLEQSFASGAVRAQEKEEAIVPQVQERAEKRATQAAPQPPLREARQHTEKTDLAAPALKEEKLTASQEKKAQPTAGHTWGEVLERLKKTDVALYGMLAVQQAKLADGKLYFENIDYLRNIIQSTGQGLSDALSAVTGSEVSVVFVSRDELAEIQEAASLGKPVDTFGSKEESTPVVRQEDAVHQADPLDELFEIEGLDIHIEE